MSLDSISCKNGLCSVCHLGNIIIYNFWANVCESLKYTRTIWQEEITARHITVGILFQGSVLVGGEVLKCSQGVVFGEARPPSSCDSALKINNMDLHSLICLVAKQTFHFLHHSNILCSFQRQI